MSASSTLRSAFGCRRSAAGHSSPRSSPRSTTTCRGASLAAVGITLRRRTEHGRWVWQLKLPSDGLASGARGEGRAAQGAQTAARASPRPPPPRIARTGRRVAHPTAAGSSSRGNGNTAEVTMDEVAVIDARRVSDRFVEVEVELRTGSPDRLDVLAGELVSGRRRARQRRAESSSARSTASPPRLRLFADAVRVSCRTVCACSWPRSSATIRAPALGAIPRASTTCASPSAACGRCYGPERSSWRPTPPSSTGG